MDDAIEQSPSPSPYSNNYNEKVLSVLTRNEVRYQGTLDKISPADGSIVLRNVTVFGTEDRPVQKKLPKYADAFPLVNLKGTNIKQATLFEYVKVNGKGQGQAPHTPAQRQDNVGKAAPSMSVQPQQPLPPKPAAPSSYLDAVRGKQQTQERNNNSNNRGWVPQGLSS